MSFAVRILILLPVLLSVEFCHSLPANHIAEKNATAASYLVKEQPLVKNEESKHFTGSKESKDDNNTEEISQAEMKYKSIKGWRKLGAAISEMKAKSDTMPSHGEHERENSGFGEDYEAPHTDPPHNNNDSEGE